MEDLNVKYKKRFDEIYHDSDILSYVGYNKESKKIEFMCKKHGLQSKEAYHLFNDRKGCKKCNIERFAKNQTSNSEEFIEKAEKLNTNNLDDFSLVNYKKSNVLVDIICHKVGFDGNEHGLYKITPNSYLNGRRCPKCKNEGISERQLLPQEEVIEKLREVYKDRPWYDFSSTVYKGRKNKIEYIKQYRVDWLDNKSLDFYLPTYNTAIECQGKQHFESVEYFGGIEEFEKRKLRDKIKFQECIDNNVRLLYYADYTYDFPYEVITDKNKLLLEIMNGKEIDK